MFQLLCSCIASERKSSRLFLQAIFAARLSIVSLFYKLTEMKSALRSVHRIHQYCNAFLRSKQKNNLAIHPPTTHSSSKSLTMRFSLLSLLLAYGNILFVYLTQLLSWASAQYFHTFSPTTKRKTETIPQYFCRHGVFQHIFPIHLLCAHFLHRSRRRTNFDRIFLSYYLVRVVATRDSRRDWGAWKTEYNI